MFCMFPDSKSEWKKWATGQSFIRKEITTYRIGALANFDPPSKKFHNWTDDNCVRLLLGPLKYFIFKARSTSW